MSIAEIWQWHNCGNKYGNNKFHNYKSPRKGNFKWTYLSYVVSTFWLENPFRFTSGKQTVQDSILRNTHTKDNRIIRLALDTSQFHSLLHITCLLCGNVTNASTRTCTSVQLQIYRWIKLQLFNQDIAAICMKIKCLLN
jgi:hypothetical protein